MYQSSPGGQSSCSSEPSPLGSATNNDSGVEMAAHSGGSLGDLSTLDDPPFVESLGCEDSTGGVAAVGLRFRKQLGTGQRLEHLKKEKLKTVRDSCRWASNPTPPVLGTKLPPIPANESLQERPRMDGGPVYFPGGLSSGKTILLENLSERRDSTSSTLSSVYTLSRRSSGISPCYSSRRSSQSSQFGANRLGSLSSADSYDPISADISRRSSQASQCGGTSIGGGGYGERGIPSPLSLTPAQHYRLKAKYAAATGGAPPTPLPYMKNSTALYNNPSNKVDSRQHSSYNIRSLMPHEVPSNIPRRASDPIRQVDYLNQPQMQRYNSMGTLSGGTTMQPHPPPSFLRSDGSPHHHPYNVRPPSISEDVNMEIPEEDLVLPTNQQEPVRGTPSVQQPSHHQRRMAIVNLPCIQSPGQHQQICSSTSRDYHWNNSLGPMGASQQYSKLQPNENLAVLQQNQNFGSFPNNPSSNQQVINTTQQRFQQSSNLNEGIRSQCRFSESFGAFDRNRNTTYPPCKQEPVDMDTVDVHFADAGFQPVQVKIEDCDASMMTSRNTLQPRPPSVPKPLNRHLSGQTRHPSQANVDAASGLPNDGVLGLRCNQNSDDNALYYTGQIQVFEQNGNLDHLTSPVVNVPPFETASPSSGDNQASRTVDCTADLVETQIDFDTMLDDGDHSSLVSGTLSPGLLQNLSQNSSRLTTPRNSVTLPPEPAATGNMAIGDMSSMLTALAEESKILDLMS